MIAILYKSGFVHMFISDLVSIDGGNVIGQDAAVKGTTANILVVDGFTHSKDETGEFITNGTVTIRKGGAIEPSNFTDTRASLPKTAEQKTIDKLKSDNEQLNLQVIDLFEQLITKGVL